MVLENKNRSFNSTFNGFEIRLVAVMGLSSVVPITKCFFLWLRGFFTFLIIKASTFPLPFHFL